MKIYRFLCALSIMAAFTAISCEKDGVYNPTRKISKIYIQEANNEKQMYAEWIWESNRLMQIVYPISQDTAHFSYEKGVISRINYTGNTPYYLTFHYDKNLYSTINLYKENAMIGSYQFFYDQKKVSKIIVTEYSSDQKTALFLEEIFALFSLPEIVSESVKEIALEYVYKGGSGDNGNGNNGEGASSVINSYSFTFTWDDKNNNISKIVTQTNSLRTTMKYMYDDNKNPFQGLFSEVSNEETMGYVYDAISYNKNNIIQSQLLVGEDSNLKEHSLIKIDYVYNKKYPIIATFTQTFADISHFENVITRWYEYK